MKSGIQKAAAQRLAQRYPGVDLTKFKRETVLANMQAMYDNLISAAGNKREKESLSQQRKTISEKNISDRLIQLFRIPADVKFSEKIAKYMDFAIANKHRPELKALLLANDALSWNQKTELLQKACETILKTHHHDAIMNEASRQIQAFTELAQDINDIIAYSGVKITPEVRKTLDLYLGSIQREIDTNKQRLANPDKEFAEQSRDMVEKLQTSIQTEISKEFALAAQAPLQPTAQVAAPVLPIIEPIEQNPAPVAAAAVNDPKGKEEDIELEPIESEEQKQRDRPAAPNQVAQNPNVPQQTAKQVLTPERQYIHDLMMSPTDSRNFKDIAGGLITIISPKDTLDQISKSYDSLQIPQERLTFLNNVTKLLVELKISDPQQINYPNFNANASVGESNSLQEIRGQFDSFIGNLRSPNQSDRLTGAIANLEGSVREVSAKIAQDLSDRQNALLELASSANTPINFRNIISSELAGSVTESRLQAIAEGVASDLFKSNAALFLAITPGELLRRVTVGESINLNLPENINLKNQSASFENMTNMIALDLLNPNISRQHQTNIAKLYIAIGEQALKNGDYKTVITISSAFNKGSVSRILELTDFNNEVQNFLKIGSELGAKNNATMRQGISEHIAQGHPVSPFLGMYIKDLTILNEVSITKELKLEADPSTAEQSSPDPSKPKIKVINEDRLKIASSVLQVVGNVQESILKLHNSNGIQTSVVQDMNRTTTLSNAELPMDEVLSEAYMPRPLVVHNKTTLPELIEAFSKINTPPYYLKIKPEVASDPRYYSVQKSAYEVILKVIGSSLENTNKPQKIQAYRILKLIEDSAEKNGLLGGMLAHKIDRLRSKFPTEIVVAHDISSAAAQFKNANPNLGPLQPVAVAASPAPSGLAQAAPQVAAPAVAAAAPAPVSAAAAAPNAGAQIVPPITIPPNVDAAQSSPSRPPTPPLVRPPSPSTGLNKLPEHSPLMTRHKAGFQHVVEVFSPSEDKPIVTVQSKRNVKHITFKLSESENRVALIVALKAMGLKNEKGNREFTVSAKESNYGGGHIVKINKEAIDRCINANPNFMSDLKAQIVQEKSKILDQGRIELASQRNMLQQVMKDVFKKSTPDVRAESGRLAAENTLKISFNKPQNIKMFEAVLRGLGFEPSITNENKEKPREVTFTIKSTELKELMAANPNLMAELSNRILEKKAPPNPIAPQAAAPVAAAPVAVAPQAAAPQAAAPVAAAPQVAQVKPPAIIVDPADGGAQRTRLKDQGPANGLPQAAAASTKGKAIVHNFKSSSGARVDIKVSTVPGNTDRVAPPKDIGPRTDFNKLTTFWSAPAAATPPVAGPQIAAPDERTNNKLKKN